MMGGLETGERAALLIPAGLAANALAMDWPWHESRKLSAFGIAIRLGAIREAILRSPAALALGVAAAARDSGVDASRIALIGVSLGAPPAVAAFRLTEMPEALAIVDGAADLETLLDAGLRREGCPGFLARPLAAIAFRLIRSLEPSLNAAAVAGRRVLLINAERDQLQPRRAIERLHRAFPGAEVRWRAARHLDPGEHETIDAIARQVEAWLEGSASPPAPALGASPIRHHQLRP